MKRILLVLLASLLSVSAFLICASAEGESFDLAITDYEGVAKEEGTDINGQLYVYPAGDADRVVTSEEFNLRYMFILVCDKDGIVLEAGNNLFKSSDPRANEFPQHEVTAPAGGHVITFYYNSENTLNRDAYDFYNELLEHFAATTDVFNETAKLNNCTYTVTYKDSAATFTRNELPEPPESSDEETSESAPPDASDDDSDATSEESGKKNDTESSSASSEGESSDASGVSDGGEDDGIPVYVWIIAGVVVIAAVAAVIVATKKKKA